MFVKLHEGMSYRGTGYEGGDIIEVDGALGDSLILNAKASRSSKEEYEAQQAEIAARVIVLTDEEVDALEYRDVQQLISKYEIETEDKSAETYKAALKAFYAGQRGE